MQVEPYSSKLPPPEKDIYARTKELMERKKSKIEQAQKMKEDQLMKELDDHGFTPRINDSTSVKRTLEDLLTWKRETNSKKEQLSQQLYMSVTLNRNTTPNLTRSTIAYASNALHGMRSFAKSSIRKESKPKSSVSPSFNQKETKERKTSKSKTNHHVDDPKPPLNFYSSFNPLNWSSNNHHEHKNPPKHSHDDWETDGYMPFSDFLNSIRPTFDNDRDSIKHLKAKVHRTETSKAKPNQNYFSNPTNTKMFRKKSKPDPPKKYFQQDARVSLPLKSKAVPVNGLIRPKNMSLVATKELKKSLINGEFDENY